jgi:outer membrane protein assembly factor BamA
MNSSGRFLLLLIACLFILPLNAQSTKDSLHRRSLAGFPIAFYSPETSWGFGGAGVFTFHFRNDTLHARPSKIQTGFAYTLNRQILLYLPFQFFSGNSRWNAYGELGYYKYSYNFYGIGNNSADFEKYKVNYPRIRINTLRRLFPGFYAGIRYWFEKDKMISVDSNGLLDTGSVIGKSGGTISGIGAVMNYDTRNDLFFPEKGVFLESSLQIFTKHLYSDYAFSRYSLDGSAYLSPYKHHVIAFNFVFEINAGEVPFNYLSMIGGTKRMRGYYEGRFRDKKLLIGQVEYRAVLYKRFGAVVFADLGSVQNRWKELSSNNFHTTLGGGLRFKLSKKENVNVRLDAGFGKESSAFYFTIGEAF